MQRHVLHGARLFQNSTSDWDDMAAEIALRHHEHWDGSGYPGTVADLNADIWQPGPGLRGEEIPLAVDAFFDNVMVMCEDAALRENRLNLLKSLVDRLGRLADFGALQV